MSRLIALAVAILILTSLPVATGQAKKKDAPQPEKKKDVNLRELAAESMKKSEVKDARIVESENLVVATALPESKAKALADSLQKTFALAAKALKFEEAEVKAIHVVIYTFADLDNFRQFQRSVLKVRPED